ncbi:MAG: hypothetical protein R3C15_07510 [Thermoleophilia bacterium]
MSTTIYIVWRNDPENFADDLMGAFSSEAAADEQLARVRAVLDAEAKETGYSPGSGVVGFTLDDTNYVEGWLRDRSD